MLKLKKSSSTIQIIIFLIFGWCLSVYLLSQWFICQIGSSSCFKISSLANWDGQHFLQIAEKGYLLPYQLAFFPLYPILIKIFSSILQLSLLTTGVLLNWILIPLAFVFLYHLLMLSYSKKDTVWIMAMMLCFPLSFFYLALYSETLFFCLSVMALFFYQKKKYWLSIIFLIMLTATRMVGIALVGAILIDLYFRKKPLDKFLLSFTGVGLFALYGYFKTGILFSIIYAESHWERLITLPGFAIYNSLSVIFREGISFKNYALVIDLVLVLLVLIILFRSYRVIPRLYFYYALFSLLIPLSTSTFLSLPRFILVIFPLFIAFYIQSNTMVRVIYCLTGFCLTILMFNKFLQGGWIS
jgi:Gpi18-like mannosyltransferase